MNDEFQRSRYRQRHKKRKTNVILNSLIAIVLLLIIVVSYNIFFSGNETASSLETGEKESSQEENSAGNKKKTDDEDLPPSNENEGKSQEQESDKEGGDSSPNNEGVGNKSEEDDNTVTEESDDPNVIESVVNPNWKPVGTEQSGEHIAVYSGIDWDEMVKAISYATGLSQEEFTIRFLGNNGPNKSVGTIYTKNKEEMYRVYIEWVDEQGWKPTKVEKLSSIE